jgi:hypothetical protein
MLYRCIDNELLLDYMDFYMFEGFIVGSIYHIDKHYNFYRIKYRSGYIDCYWSLSDFELSFMAIEDYRDKVINELL